MSTVTSVQSYDSERFPECKKDTETNYYKSVRSIDDNFTPTHVQLIRLD